MNLFTRYAQFKKDKAIRSYIIRLPALLALSYGHSDIYTPEQVIKSIELSSLPQDYKSYAVVMFCDREAFERYYQITDEPWIYDDLRAKIARLHFHGYIYFTVADVYRASDEGNSSATECSSDSGSCDSGSSDGGGGGD